MALFPVIMLAVYGILFVIMPDKALLAIKSSVNIFFNMLIPLSMIFVLMLLINLFLNPARVAKFLGKGSGIKGIILSAAAGIISTGPIYAWYPLLKDLREKGAGDSSIAIFLYNRAVKPFLLPVMVAYFGWLYVVILTILTVLASVAIGYSVDIFMKADQT
jgi:uncharacterized membrane protein YraQ (UPF0718 family)